MSNIPLRQTSQQTSQAGMVAIMVTMVLMLVISLIVLGFAQISRRNQRQALDRQLSTQAFYAAETGVNDVREIIEQAFAAGNTVPEKSTCGPGSGVVAAFYGSLTPTIDNGVEYSCLIVDPSPTSLQYGSIGTTSTIVPLMGEGGANLSTVRFSWKTKESTTTPVNNCPTGVTNVFTNTSSWNCGYGILRFDLVPTSGNNNIDSLSNAVMTTFAVPRRTGGTNSIPFAAGSGNTNNVAGVACNNTECALTVTGLSANQYYLRVSSIYKDAGLQITATNGAGNPLGLEGAQVLVDSTGKAQDVLRRIQVRVPIGPGRNDLPDYVIQSTDSVCKRFSVMTNLFQSGVTGVTSSNPLCQP